MPSNAERRVAIATAGVTVLAGRGARGLTHRAVDAEAGLPQGTTSNYHPSRESLREAVAGAVLVRLPRSSLLDRDPGEVPAALVDDVAAWLDDLVALTAWFELRLLVGREAGLGEVVGAVERLLGTAEALGASKDVPGTVDEHLRLARSLDGVLLAAATGSVDRDTALADAEALVRSVVPQRRWYNLR